MKHYLKIMAAAALIAIGMIGSYAMGASYDHLTCLWMVMVCVLAMIVSWVCLGYGISWLMSLSMKR